MKPVIIKPVDSGSTVGVSLARTQDELAAGIALAQKKSKAVFVEDYIEGAEFTVAVIEVGGKLIALPVISIKSKNVLFDFDAKYVPGMAEETCPAEIPEELSKRLQAAALTAHKAIGARHVSRTDLIVDRAGNVWFLEINTIPGMSVLLPKAIAASGRNFGDVLSGWIEEVTA